MERTQISLTDEERRVLDAEARRSGLSLSALIREAVDRTYGAGRSAAEDVLAIQVGAGAWVDRAEEDNGTASDDDGAHWVERIRSGARLADRQ